MSDMGPSPRSTPRRHSADPTSSPEQTGSPALSSSTSAGKPSRFRLEPGEGIARNPDVWPSVMHAVPALTPATPHVVKFSGPDDAQNAHADADHGVILVTAEIRLIFWGREWNSPSPAVPMASVISDVQSIVSGPYLDGLAQYSVGKPFVGRVLTLTDEDPPNPIGKGDAADRVGRLMDDGVLPEPDQDTVPAVNVVFLPSEVAGSTLTRPPDLAGLHNRLRRFEWTEFGFYDAYVAWIGNDGTRDFISHFFSHELVEALTDPDGSGWQVEPRNDSDWNEVCDVCKSTFNLNGVEVASYWSNQDNSCIVTDSDSTTYTVQWIWRPSRIEWFGGVDEENQPWQFPRLTVMQRIRSGDHFKVHGAGSGRDSVVGIYYLDPTHPYLATNTDGVPDDNLLALPQRPPG